MHEYVSMEIMRKFDVPVPKGGMAETVADAEKVYKSVIGDGKDCVIKAMVLTGASFLPSGSSSPFFVVRLHPILPSFPPSFPLKAAVAWATSPTASRAACTSAASPATCPESLRRCWAAT